MISKKTQNKICLLSYFTYHHKCTTENVCPLLREFCYAKKKLHIRFFNTFFIVLLKDTF